LVVHACPDTEVHFSSSVPPERSGEFPDLFAFLKWSAVPGGSFLIPSTWSQPSAQSITKIDDPLPANLDVRSELRFPGGSWILVGDFAANHFPSPAWGVGGDRPDSDETFVDSRGLVLHETAYWRNRSVTDGWRA
jgi:hypothetical protein